MAKRFHSGLPKILRQAPIAIAHRGGALLPENLGKENSLEAFANAVELGYTYLETDLRTTRDGEIFAFHDADLRRSLGEPTKFADLFASDVRELRLAAGARIATLVELLEEFPDALFNIDFKDDAGVDRGLAQIDQRKAAERVVIASFSNRRLRRVRTQAPHLLTSASQSEVLRMRFGRRPWDVRRPIALQIPEFYGGVRVLTPRLVQRAHEHGLQVHVWTIDDPATMTRLLDLGVDGIITDRPDVLKQVLIERGQWENGTPLT